MLTEKTTPSTYSTLEEIRMRKDQLSDAIERDSEQIGTMWNQLFAKQENATKGEYIASIVANSITAIDAFLLVRKLMKNYGGLFRFATKKKDRKQHKH